MREKQFVELTTDEVLEYYGYKPEEIHGNRVGYNVWKREDALHYIGYVSEIMPHVNEKEKVKLEFHYDPNFPAALIVMYATLGV